MPTPSLVERVATETGLTQRGLAHVLGVSPRAVSGWREEREPPEAVRLVLEEILQGHTSPEVATKIEEARRLHPDRRRRETKP